MKISHLLKMTLYNLSSANSLQMYVHEINSDHYVITYSHIVSFSAKNACFCSVRICENKVILYVLVMLLIKISL